jgi:hypothetical protein
MVEVVVEAWDRRGLENTQEASNENPLRPFKRFQANNCSSGKAHGLIKVLLTRNIIHLFESEIEDTDGFLSLTHDLFHQKVRTNSESKYGFHRSLHNGSVIWECILQLIACDEDTGVKRSTEYLVLQYTLGD